jgi:hypothetical protein
MSALSSISCSAPTTTNNMCYRTISPQREMTSLVLKFVVNFERFGFQTMGNTCSFQIVSQIYHGLLEQICISEFLEKTLIS